MDLLQEGRDFFESRKLIKERATGFVKISNLDAFCIFNRRNIFILSKDLKTRIKLPSTFLEKMGITDITQITENRKGHIFILTTKGLLRFVPGDMLRKIPTGLNIGSAQMGLWNDNLVLTGDFGVSLIATSSSKNSVRLYTNLKGESFSSLNKLILDSVGRAFLVTDRGVFSLQMKDIVSDTNFRQDGQSSFSFVSNHRATLLKDMDTLVIAPGTSNLVFKTLNARGSGIPQIVFRLRNERWSFMKGDLFHTDGLEPDMFHCLDYFAIDDFGRSNSRRLFIIKQPFWWQRPVWKFTFILAGVLFFATSILVAVLISRRITAKSIEKRRLQQELELRAVHSQINPHFIFNTLSTALYFISSYRINDAYEHVSKFSKLLRSYLTSSRERFITLADEAAALAQYIELQRARFERKFRYEIVIAPDLQPNNILLPSLLLQPLVENAINHGLFNKGDAGVLRI